jgi:hypothetical protein
VSNFCDACYCDNSKFNFYYATAKVYVNFQPLETHIDMFVIRPDGL